MFDGERFAANCRTAVDGEGGARNLRANRRTRRAAMRKVLLVMMGVALGIAFAVIPYPVTCVAGNSSGVGALGFDAARYSLAYVVEPGSRSLVVEI